MMRKQILLLIVLAITLLVIGFASAIESVNVTNPKGLKNYGNYSTTINLSVETNMFNGISTIQSNVSLY